MSDETREKRYADGLELRMASEGSNSPGTLVGYPVVFDRPSDLISDRSADRRAFREVVRPGACSRSIRSHDIRAMLDHDPAKVLGRSTAGTLRLSEDAKGVRCEIDLPDTTAGRDTAVSVARRDLTGMSFGFRVASPEGQKWERESSPPVRHLHDIDIDDVSVVAYPAYADTSVALRSLDRAILDALPAEPEPIPDPAPAETVAPPEPDPEVILRERERDRHRLRMLCI